jgi:hypothetical protein
MSNVGVGPKNKTQNVPNGTEQSNLLRAFVLRPKHRIESPDFGQPKSNELTVSEIMYN